MAQRVSHFIHSRSRSLNGSEPKLSHDCLTSINENTKVNNELYLSILELCNDALLLLEARSTSPAKLEEIGLFEPQRMMGIFGALVSNDRAAEWVEGE